MFCRFQQIPEILVAVCYHVRSFKAIKSRLHLLARRYVVEQRRDYMLQQVAHRERKLSQISVTIDKNTAQKRGRYAE